jgi:tetratricopeptide (TPR) repeat protein
MDRSRQQRGDVPTPPPDLDEPILEDLGEVRDVATGAVERGGRPAPADRRPPRPAARPDRRRSRPARELTDELSREVGADRGAKFATRLAEAGRLFSRQRYQDARRILRDLVERAPGSPAARELHGLTLYRLGRWREAARELEQFRLLTHSTEQNPVLADCYRALRRYTEVDELWTELREASPSAELVAEGRIVAAGAAADRGDLSDAIRLLERGLKFPKRPQTHHLRLWYALADLYERAGEVGKARQLFGRVVEVDADFADAAARVRALR